MIAQIADRFHVLPTAVEKDLDNDPDLTAMRCVELLAYAETFYKWKGAKNEQEFLKQLNNSESAKAVIENDFVIANERRNLRGVAETQR